MIRQIWPLLVGLALCSGCAHMNSRQVKGCYAGDISVNASRLHAGGTGWILTGGMTAEECVTLINGLGRPDGE